MEKIYKQNGAGLSNRNGRSDRDKTTKHVSVSKTVTRDSSNRMVITLTMTKTIVMQRILPATAKA